MSMTKDEILKIRRERRGQVLNIGDHVIAHAASENPLYDGKVATIIEKGISGNKVYYGLYIEGVTIEKRTKTTIGRKSEIIGNTSLLAPFFDEDLELVDAPNPKVKVGDRVETAEGMGTAKIVSDDGGYVVSQLDNGERCVIITASIPGKEEKPTAENSEENNPYVGAKPVTIEQARRELYEIGKEMRNPEYRKQVDEEWCKELAAKKNETICGETVPTPAWQSYRMELAMAVAIAYAEKGRYEPSEIGAKAVEVADGVVDRLKKKQQ